jgi:hypothetical protein
MVSWTTQWAIFSGHILWRYNLRPTWIAWGLLCAVYLFGAGLLIGRETPRHHFGRFGNGPFLFDTSTGYVCRAMSTKDDVFADYGGRLVDPSAPKDANGFQIVKPSNPVDQALGNRVNATDSIKLCVSSK